MELQAMPKEMYAIIVLAIVLTALVVAGATPDQIRSALDSGFSGYRLPAASAPADVSQQ